MASAKNNSGSAEASVRTMEELQRQYGELNTRKTRAEVELENAQKELTKLQLEADEQFGTHDVQALQQKLEQMEAENEQRRGQYQQLLDGITGELAQIDAGESTGSDSSN